MLVCTYYFKLKFDKKSFFEAKTNNFSLQKQFWDCAISLDKDNDRFKFC